MLLAFLVPATAGAQSNTVRDEWLASYHHFGVAAAMTYPFQDFGDDYSTGFGLHGMVDYPWISLVHLIADVGWNHFPGKNDSASVDIFNISGGAKIALGAFFMGGEVGYFSEVDEVSWIPSIGVRPGNWEVALRIKAVGLGSWTTLRAGYYF